MTNPHRRALTALVGNQPVQVAVEPALLDDLGSQDWFIGPSGDLYEVTCPASDHRNGWTEVTNLSMPVEVERALQAENGEAGADPRAGFFSYPGQDVLVDRVLELTAGSAQKPLDDHGRSVLAMLTARWVERTSSTQP